MDDPHYCKALSESLRQKSAILSDLGDILMWRGDEDDGDPLTLLSSLSAFSSAALQPLLVHGGAPGHAGHPGQLGTAQLLGSQRRSHAGARRVEERWHLHEPGLGREAAHSARWLAALHPCGSLQTQQARWGHLPVCRHHRKCWIHLQSHSTSLRGR